MVAPAWRPAAVGRRKRSGAPARLAVFYWQVCVHIDGGWEGCKRRHTAPVDRCNVCGGVHLHVACGDGVGWVPQSSPFQTADFLHFCCSFVFDPLFVLDHACCAHCNA